MMKSKKRDYSLSAVKNYVDLARESAFSSALNFLEKQDLLDSERDVLYHINIVFSDNLSMLFHDYAGAVDKVFSMMYEDDEEE